MMATRCWKCTYGLTSCEVCDAECATVAGVTSFCGDTLVNGAETCDDGNDVDTDACRNQCIDARCGDGVVWAGTEACDDGDSDNTDACLNTCIVASCGDGFVQSGIETCDDGNNVDGDYCSADCSTITAVCGDGEVGPGESCDDGNQVETDFCLNDCTNASCGDGIVNRDEVCDDGDTRVGIGPCNQNCTAVRDCGGFSQLGNCSTGWGIFESWDRFLSAGLNHACGVIYDGGVYCWGIIAVVKMIFQRTLILRSLVAAGTSHSCSVDISGQVSCWGGAGNATITTVPADLPPAIWVSAGGDATCAISQDQSVRQLGRHHLWSNGLVPSDLGPVRSLSVGSQHVCAAPVEGGVRCWGENTYGQLNVPADLGNVLQVKSGGFHSCAVDGTNLKCWGRDENGQLGTEEFDRSTLGTPDKFFSVGYDFSCGMTAGSPSGSRGLTCTGPNSYGQHGPG